MARDATVTTSVREDAEGKFRRTAIHIRACEDGSKLASVDVLGLDGRLICRLNIFDFQGSPDQEACVDVVLDGSRQRGRFFALDKGRPQVSLPTVPGTTVHAVVITPPNAFHGDPVPAPASAPKEPEPEGAMSEGESLAIARGTPAALDVRRGARYCARCSCGPYHRESFKTHRCKSERVPARRRGTR